MLAGEVDLALLPALDAAVRGRISPEAAARVRREEDAQRAETNAERADRLETEMGFERGIRRGRRLAERLTRMHANQREIDAERSQHRLRRGQGA